MYGDDRIKFYPSQKTQSETINGYVLVSVHLNKRVIIIIKMRSVNIVFCMIQPFHSNYI